MEGHLAKQTQCVHAGNYVDPATGATVSPIFPGTAYPYLDVEHIYHRDGAIFPATVVGRPPQEDHYIAIYLQEMFSPLFPVVMKGVKDVFAYEESGVHSLAGAIVSERYHREGLEGHHLEPYQGILEHIQRHPHTVRLHAGFISKKYARMLMREGEEAALAAAKPWLPDNLTNLQGMTPFHYNYFESLLTGRNLHHSLVSSLSSPSPAVG